LSPRIGILGQSTFPSEHDYYMSSSQIGQGPNIAQMHNSN